jgi:hypothetical protein
MLETFGKLHGSPVLLIVVSTYCCLFALCCAFVFYSIVCLFLLLTSFLLQFFLGLDFFSCE